MQQYISVPQLIQLSEAYDQKNDTHSADDFVRYVFDWLSPSLDDDQPHGNC